VVFKNGKPSKKDYRRFNIKTVSGSDDFSSMEEIVYRRYKRIMNENGNLPDLIIVDGGKGQLNSAVKSLTKISLNREIPIIGIAKKLEEIYFPDDSIPLYLDKKSETLKLIQNIRNEAHRFGISFHRNKRLKSMIISELDNIDGIGPKRKEKLLSEFNSVSDLKKADFEKLVKIIGKSKAEKLYKYFNSSTGSI